MEAGNPKKSYVILLTSSLGKDGKSTNKSVFSPNKKGTYNAFNVDVSKLYMFLSLYIITHSIKHKHKEIIIGGISLR